MDDMKQKELLDSILRYVVPTLKKEAKKQSKELQNKKDSELEEILHTRSNSNKDFIDDIIKSVFKDVDKSKLKISGIEEEISIQQKEKSKIATVQYGSEIHRDKDDSENKSFGYKVSIEYEENEIEESIKLTVSFDDYDVPSNTLNKKDPLDKNNSKINNKNKDQKNNYSVSITREKEEISSDNYKISVVYENTYEEERLAINYKAQIGSYLNIRDSALHDFTDRVPGKHVDIHPATIMGGVLGFTYLGQDRMALRDDLIGDKEMVDIHESIHTPDEYETRVLTDWIMSKPAQKYIK